MDKNKQYRCKWLITAFFDGKTDSAETPRWKKNFNLDKTKSLVPIMILSWERDRLGRIIQVRAGRPRSHWRPIGLFTKERYKSFYLLWLQRIYGVDLPAPWLSRLWYLLPNAYWLLAKPCFSPFSLEIASLVDYNLRFALGSLCAER